jgi:hypothetical protein
VKADRAKRLRARRRRMILTTVFLVALVAGSAVVTASKAMPYASSVISP